MTEPTSYLPERAALVAVFLIVASAATFFCTGLFAQEDATVTARRGADNVEIIYRGLLQDDAGEPVSGVFPLTFTLYRGSMSADSLWNERHFVSVVDGRYQVSLGRQSPLREHLLVGERWIGIELGEEGEILRDGLTIDRPEGNAAPEQPSTQRLSHADVAEHATEAERARVADNALALDGMTADEIEEIAGLALQRLGEHIADPEAHSVSARHRIGSERKIMENGGGGRGGTPYDVRCPEGHVVTGIEGRAGRLVDYVTVVCSPLR